MFPFPALAAVAHEKDNLPKELDKVNIWGELQLAPYISDSGLGINNVADLNPTLSHFIRNENKCFFLPDTQYFYLRYNGTCIVIKIPIALTSRKIIELLNKYKTQNLSKFLKVLNIFYAAENLSKIKDLNTFPEEAANEFLELLVESSSVSVVEDALDLVDYCPLLWKIFADAKIAILANKKATSKANLQAKTIETAQKFMKNTLDLKMQTANIPRGAVTDGRNNSNTNNSNTNNSSLDTKTVSNLKDLNTFLARKKDSALAATSLLDSFELDFYLKALEKCTDTEDVVALELVYDLKNV